MNPPRHACQVYDGVIAFEQFENSSEIAQICAFVLNLRMDLPGHVVACSRTSVERENFMTTVECSQNAA